MNPLTSFRQTIVRLMLAMAPLGLAGCFFDDGPKIVPAKSGLSSPIGAMRPPQKMETKLSVNKSLEGSQALCANYESGPIWMSYGEKGSVIEGAKNGTSRTGFRFELGNPIMGNHRTGFQFDKNEEPRLFKRDQSDGALVELLNDEKSDAPIMRCFKAPATGTIWIEYDLLEQGQALQGHWTCEGPLGALSVDESGLLSTGQGPAQSFFWTHKKAPLMTVFFQSSAAVSPGAQTSFDRFFEATLNLEGLPSNQWSYETTGSDGRSSKNTCVRAPIAAKTP